MGMPMVTRIRAIMRPRRLRSSMNRVAIMPPVGIHDPRRSRGHGDRRRSRGRSRVRSTSGVVVIASPPVGS